MNSPALASRIFPGATRRTGTVWRTKGRIVTRQSRSLSHLDKRPFTTSRIHPEQVAGSGSAVTHAPPTGTSTSTTTQIAAQDLLETYRGLVASGRLAWDDEQVRTVMKLRHLFDELQDYTPPLDLLAKLTASAPSAAKRASLSGKWWDSRAGGSFGSGEEEKNLVKVLSGQEEIANLPTPKGIMITGPPGTGKSMLLSLFFDSLPTTHKRRWHYHAFTLYLYRQVFVEMEKRRTEEKPEMKEENKDKAAKKGWKSVFAGGRWEDEPAGTIEADVQDYARTETIPFIIARRMILDYHLLYFDEMQLVDASSAALLRDVLSWYWRLGGVVITCSNRVPDDLYHHGVQKDRMAGFLDSLKARCEVVELDGGRDWRGGVDGVELENRVKWYINDQGGFESAWSQATEGKAVAPVNIGVYGRRVHVPAAAEGTCRMTFSALCEEALGPADYLSLASTFHTFFIDAVPILLLKNKNEARRLINLIDALYESRCQLFVSSATTLDEIFFPDAVTATAGDTRIPTPERFDLGDTNESIMAAEALSETLHAAPRPNVSVYNPFESQTRERKEAAGAKGASSFGVLGIWTGEDERFAYKRAVSRMREMTTSPTYARETWLPLAIEGRIWESKITAPPPSPRKTLPSVKGGSDTGLPAAETGDYATEAAYSRPGRLTPRRPEEGFSEDKRLTEAARLRLGGTDGAPVIKEKHVWGVVDEWGEKAGKWGKGTKAFKKEGED